MKNLIIIPTAKDIINSNIINYYNIALQPRLIKRRKMISYKERFWRLKTVLYYLMRICFDDMFIRGRFLYV